MDDIKSKFITTDNYELVIEELSDKLRLVIVKDENELACRKTTKKELTQFLDSDETNLFKGRLQLKKNGANKIEITLKGYKK